MLRCPSPVGDREFKQLGRGSREMRHSACAGPRTSIAAYRVAKIRVQPIGELGDARGDLVEVDGLFAPIALDDKHGTRRTESLDRTEGADGEI